MVVADLACFNIIQDFIPNLYLLEIHAQHLRGITAKKRQHIMFVDNFQQILYYIEFIEKNGSIVQPR